MKQRHGGDWVGYLEENGRKPLDFSASISPLGMPDSVRKAILESLDDAWRYPDPQCRRLRRGLANRYGVRTEQTVCGNGAADLIFRLCRCLHPKKALLTAPAFSEYERALRAVHCEIDRIFLRSENAFRLEADDLCKQLTGDTDLVFLCNPDNPSGQLSERNEIRSVLAQCRKTGTRLVLDECFMEFAEEEESCSLTEEVSEWPELVILRAFTKSFAMAGLRLGYALCGDESVAALLRNEGQPWPVSHPAQEAGLAALGEKDYLARMRETVHREREKMSLTLSGLGLHVVPGKANYLLFCCGDPELGVKLRKYGILLRDCGQEPGLTPGWFRAAVRTEAENAALFAALREVL